MFSCLMALRHSELTLLKFSKLFLHTPYKISSSYSLYRKAKFDSK